MIPVYLPRPFYGLLECLFYAWNYSAFLKQPSSFSPFVPLQQFPWAKQTWHSPCFLLSFCTLRAPGPCCFLINLRSLPSLFPLKFHFPWKRPLDLPCSYQSSACWKVGLMCRKVAFVYVRIPQGCRKGRTAHKDSAQRECQQCIFFLKKVPFWL